jgi:hypothetical protein
LLKRIDLSRENRRLDDLAPSLIRNAALAGGIALAISVLIAFMTEGGRLRFFNAYMVNFCFFLSLSLGALFFIMVQHLSRAGWSVVVRRVAEGVSANLALLILLFLPVILGMHYLFPWTRADLVAADPLLQWKQPYLNIPFFLVRCVVYFGVWVGLANYLRNRSLEQDVSGDIGLTLRMERISAPGIIVFSLTLTFAAFDFIMSRDPHWFSTIFGVYYFAGCILSFHALNAVLFYLLHRAGRLKHAVTPEHFHDIGKLMFAFTVFWAYISFSQFMLIWYAHLPEETGWFDRRQSSGWMTISMIIVLCHFIIPFFGLISRYPKRRPPLLAFWGVWILVFHWLDLYWMTMPEYGWGIPGMVVDKVPFHILDFTTFLALGGFYVAGLVYWLRGQSLIPERDPRLAESLAFENA